LKPRDAARQAAQERGSGRHGLDRITVVDPVSWTVVRTLPTGAGPDGMAFSRIQS
jgi:hypothetical protein